MIVVEMFGNGVNDSKNSYFWEKKPQKKHYIIMVIV